MPVKRTVKSTIKLAPKPEPVKVEKEERVKKAAPQEEVVSVEGKEGSDTVVKKAKKVCAFCTKKEEPKYWDLNSIRRYLNDRSRIYPRTRSGLCAKHQRRVTKQIKYARHLAMLPFTASV
jgi:small subunit ribosomal protein S18